MDGVNAREKEKPMVQNLLNLTGVNRPSRKCECLAIAPTVLCINRPHNINVILYSMFNLKAPLFKGVGGDPNKCYIYSMFNLKAPLFKGVGGGSE
ncbi:hypothetical protein CENA302_07165 [Cylindrospermopsis raciborskii CENA302]|uniref:Uncharacterized protein n=1 Tax=Cylindrospermopsis raciborskii CENA302 TaxID=1170768 RepID=A0A9Q5W9U4_9CYAN|nr:hypothetical protein BCV64_12115 [Cylindrospermopsis raciborskii MVCC14]OPH10122.1 hypothetical protein CENA302_07165 [Cylindrospermopsis raciborskii CENA302]